MTDFAVVIPTYRRPTYLAEAVDSVLGQSHPPAEVVVVCDGPGTTIADELRRGDVQVIEQPHGGEAVARNTGVAATTAEWVCFLDDDDLWHPDRLQRAADHLEEQRADLAGCLEAAQWVEPVTDMSYLDITGRSFELLLERNRGNISGATVRRDVLQQAGVFPAGYTCAADWLMFLNVARYTEWCFLDARLSFVRKHAGNNTSANPTNGLVTVRAIREAWSEQSQPVPAHRPLAGYGTDYRWTVQNAVWGSIRRRRFAIALDTLREGLPLLPQAKDKAYALLPPQITWRFEHRADGRHARDGAA